MAVYWLDIPHVKNSTFPLINLYSCTAYVVTIQNKFIHYCLHLIVHKCRYNLIQGRHDMDTVIVRPLVKTLISVLSAITDILIISANSHRELLNKGITEISSSCVGC